MVLHIKYILFALRSKVMDVNICTGWEPCKILVSATKRTKTVTHVTRHLFYIVYKLSTGTSSIMVTAQETNGDPEVAGTENKVTETQSLPNEAFNDARSILEELHVHIKQYEELDPSSEARDGVFSAGLVSILKLRKSHRTLCELVERFREQTAGVKSELDVSSLHLQNLLYQKNHYQREIQACTSYVSAYSDAELELLTEEEFLKDVHAHEQEKPSESSKGEIGEDATSDVEEGAIDAMEVEDIKKEQGGDEEHQKRLRRLRHEVHRRKVSLEELATLKSERDSVAAELAKQRNTLSDIEAEVARLKQSVQRSLNAFEGTLDDTRGLNAYAEEFIMPQ